MVRLNKSPLPDGIAITCEKHYRTDPVFSIVKEDCYNKCYICEDKKPTGINVEHRVAHKGNPVLQFCWENLMFSCSHCNSAKNQYYNNILDCTKVDPEDYIWLSMKPYPKENVMIDTVRQTDGVTETVQLLERVYNGTSTIILALECENLKSKILDELVSFQNKLMGYYNASNTTRKNDYRNAIVDMIDRSSAFAAFKRKIIWDNPVHMCEFGEYLA